MKATYLAIDGVSRDGNESLLTLCGEDSILGSNLLNEPEKIGSWSTGNSAALAQENVKEFSMTNGAASNGYCYQAITTVANTWYMVRVYCYTDNNNNTRILAGTSAGSGGLKTGDTKTGSNEHLIWFQASGTTTYISFENTQSITNIVSIWSYAEVLKINSLGVDETTELITDGDFPSDTNWALGTGWAVAAGVMDATAGTASRFYQEITDFVVGDDFHAEITGANRTAGSIQIQVGDGVSTWRQVSADYATNGTLTCNFKIGSGETYIAIYKTSTYDGDVDNFTCKQTGNLIANGDFAFDDGGDAWALGSNWAISGGVLTHTSGSAATAYGNNINLSPNAYHTVLVTISNLTAGSVIVYFSLGGIPSYSDSLSGNDTYEFTIYNNGSNTRVSFLPTTDFDGDIDNITIRQGFPVLDSNSLAPMIYGELAEIPVNYNSTTISLSNFSDDNYLEIPAGIYSPGTDDFSIRFWFKRYSNSATGFLISYAYYTGGAWSGSAIHVIMTSTGLIRGQISDDGFSTSDIITSTNAYDDGVWHLCELGRYSSGGTDYLYLEIDGQSVASDVTITNAAGSLTNSNATLLIGASQSAGSQYFLGLISIAAIEFGDYLTSQESLTKYNNEYPLFQPNEIYSYVGKSMVFSAKATMENPGRAQSINYEESEDGTREYIEKYNKETYAVTTGPLTILQKNKLNKMFKSIAGQSFVLNTESFDYGGYNPKTVYIETKKPQIPRISNAKNLWQASFTVREV